jgi:hypothetical protein
MILVYSNFVFFFFINCKALPCISWFPLGIILGLWIGVGSTCLLEDADNLEL